MANLDGWDWALLVVAGYAATLSLVHLMRGYRDSVLRQLGEQLGKHSYRRASRRRSQPRADGSPEPDGPKKTKVA
jgi:hypothetical protein